MKEITQYLKDVATLECQLYTQDKLISRLRYRAVQLGKSKKYDKPVLNTNYSEPDYGSIAMLTFAGVGAAWVAFLMILIKMLPEGFLKRLPSQISILLLFGAPLILMCIIFVLSIMRHDTKQQKEKKKTYEYNLEQYNTWVQKDNLRVKQEMVVKRTLEEQVNQILRERNITQRALDSLYSIGIIHPKYREFVAVSSFYDYFDTGRCDTFTGRGGAYDTYEYERHLQLIETKLDVIISKLDQIIENQHLIASLMQEANSALYRIERQNDRMMKSMSRIEENSELIEYNTRCAAQSTAVMEHIAVYQALKYE